MGDRNRKQELFTRFLSQKQELGNKLNISSINIGAFDPTSDYPASQKSIAEYSAAKADLDKFTKTFYDNCDVALYMNKDLRDQTEILSKNGALYVPYSDKVTSLRSFCQNATAKDNFSETPVAIEVPDINNAVNGNAMFLRAMCKEIVFNNITIKDPVYAFMECREVTSVSVADGKTAKIIGNMFGAFYGSSSIVNIGAFDVSEATNLYLVFAGCHSLKSLHFKHIKLSFDISFSTAFEQSDLVEIISNLDPVSTPRTLTMGSTNLAKLTQEQILVATGKGWTLA